MEVLICLGISAMINDDINSVQYNHVIRYESHCEMFFTIK